MVSCKRIDPEEQKRSCRKSMTRYREELGFAKESLQWQRSTLEFLRTCKRAGRLYNVAVGVTEEFKVEVGLHQRPLIVFCGDGPTDE